MTAIRSLDKSRRVDVVMRKGDTFTWVIACKNADTTDYDFTGHAATCKVYSNASDKTENFSFVVALSEGQILITMTAVNSAKVRRHAFIYFLVLTMPDASIITWLNGALIVNEGLFDGVVQTTEIIINPAGQEINLIIG